MSSPLPEGNPIDLHKLPLADLMSWMEMNPPSLPWSALTNIPFAGIPFASLQQYVAPSPGPITGFAASLGPKLVPANYAHLLMVCSIQSAGAQDNPVLTFNSDSGAHYSWGYVGTAASAFNTAQSGIRIPAGAAASTAASRSSALILVPNFLESGIGKTAFGIVASPGTGEVYAFMGGWSVTDPINEFGFSTVNNIKAGSTFSAYALGAQS